MIPAVLDAALALGIAAVCLLPAYIALRRDRRRHAAELAEIHRLGRAAVEEWRGRNRS